MKRRQSKENYKTQNTAVVSIKWPNSRKLFSSNSMSPDSKSDSSAGVLSSSMHNTMYNSPKNKKKKQDAKSSKSQLHSSQSIVYHSMGNILEISEEYQEFLKRKFSKLVSNRNTGKKNDNRNSLKMFNKYIEG